MCYFVSQNPPVFAFYSAWHKIQFSQRCSEEIGPEIVWILLIYLQNVEKGP